MQLIFVTFYCQHVHSNEMGTFICQGNFNSLSTTCSIVEYLYVKTNSIVKIWEENLFVYTKFEKLNRWKVAVPKLMIMMDEEV